MIRVCILASSSSGNCIFVGTDQIRVLVDAGLSLRETEARLGALGESLDNIDAMFITHEHIDHVKGLGPLSRRIRKPIYATHLTAEMISDLRSEPQHVAFSAGDVLNIRDLEITSFSVPHDSIDPVMYRFRTQGIQAAIVTDLGHLSNQVKEQLRGSDLLILEANHDLDLLRLSPYPWQVKQRIGGRTGHLSNSAVHDFILNDLDASLSTLILGHLSENTNYPSLVQQTVSSALQMRGLTLRTHIACPGEQTPSFIY